MFGNGDKRQDFVTAAHCVYDTAVNQFYANWVFTPAFRNGSAPYGSFSATACTILTAWVNLSGGFSINSWTRYDVAVCSWAGIRRADPQRRRRVCRTAMDLQPTPN